MGRAALGILIFIALLAVGGFIAKRIYLDAAPAPPRSLRTLDLDALRRLAQSAGDALPLAVRSELIGEWTLPSGAVVAGRGFDPHPMVQTAFQIVYADGFGIIDTGYDRELAQELSPDAAFYPDRFRSLQEALRRADWIVVTSENSDHLGGIARTPHPEDVLGRVILSAEQFENGTELERAGLTRASLERVTVIDYSDTWALAPGVVLIAAAGHTPGSQLVYVLCGKGEQFLFVGDLVWDRDNLEELTGRPRLVSELLLGEDRLVVLDQLRWLHDFSRRHPEVHLVISHDASEYERYLADGLIASGFAD